MKLNYKRIHIGRRTLKSAMAAMENTFKQSIEACMAQFIGKTLGYSVKRRIDGIDC